MAISTNLVFSGTVRDLIAARTSEGDRWSSLTATIAQSFHAPVSAKFRGDAQKIFLSPHIGFPKSPAHTRSRGRDSFQSFSLSLNGQNPTIPLGNQENLPKAHAGRQPWTRTCRPCRRGAKHSLVPQASSSQQESAPRRGPSFSRGREELPRALRQVGCWRH